MQIFLNEASGPTQVPSELTINTSRARGRRRVSRLIAEVRMNRTGVTGLEDMNREMDDLIVTAHQTLDTEQAAAEALQKLFDLWQDLQNDPAKAAALMQEMQAGELLAQPIRQPPPVNTTTTTPEPKPRRHASPSGKRVRRGSMGKAAPAGCPTLFLG